MTNSNNGSATDLSHLDDAYAAVPDSESAPYGPIPDGDYEVYIRSADLATARTGVPLLKWGLVITGPRSQGRYLWRNSVLTADNVRWIKHDLKLCGLDLGKLSELPANIHRLLGVRLAVAVKTKGQYQNVYLNRRLEGVQAVPEREVNAAKTPYDDDDVPF